MNITEFFELPEETRDYLAKLHEKQKRIRNKRDMIAQERAELSTDELSNQSSCEHPNVVKTHQADTGNYDRNDTYWTVFQCPDCTKRWSEDGSK